MGGGGGAVESGGMDRELFYSVPEGGRERAGGGCSF